MAESQVTSRFGASIRNLRYRLGISQETLAERADLHRTYIAGIEGGMRNVTLKSIDKLARALQVSTATLFLNAGKSNGPAESSGGESAAGQRVDILMVEDNHDDVELALQAFKQARITNPVEIVRDGQEALDYLFCKGRFAFRKLQSPPQLVLLDLNLPKIDGVEVLRRIKGHSRTRKIPVVVLTVSQASKDIAECLRLGAETYIVKPVDFQSMGRATPRLNLNWMLCKPVKTDRRVVRT
jgi:CheY-like chemotaxis protein